MTKSESKTARIDPKTAKKFVKGMLSVADADLTLSSDKDPEPYSYKNRNPLKKTHKRQAELEAHVSKAFGGCLLDLVWRGRWMFCCGVEPMSPNDISNRPYHARLRFITINTRSDVSNDGDVAEITTHAMERMLERSSNPNLLEVLAAEFTFDFVERLAETIAELRTSDKGLIQRTELKVSTTSGCACIVLGGEGDPCPVITTWYRLPPEINT